MKRIIITIEPAVPMEPNTLAEYLEGMARNPYASTVSTSAATRKVWTMSPWETTGS